MAAQLFRADEATLQARAVRSCCVRRARSECDSNRDFQIGVWQSSQRVAARSYRARAASGQDAAREQDCANQDCDQHGAHDTKPFLVGRRVGNFPFQNVAHRTTPSTIVMPSPVLRVLVGEKFAAIVERLTQSWKKPDDVAFWSQRRSGPLAYREGTRD